MIVFNPEELIFLKQRNIRLKVSVLKSSFPTFYDTNDLWHWQGFVDISSNGVYKPVDRDTLEAPALGVYPVSATHSYPVIISLEEAVQEYVRGAKDKAASTYGTFQTVSNETVRWTQKDVECIETIFAFEKFRVDREYVSNPDYPEVNETLGYALFSQNCKISEHFDLTRMVQTKLITDLLVDGCSRSIEDWQEIESLLKRLCPQWAQDNSAYADHFNLLPYALGEKALRTHGNKLISRVL